MRGQELSRALPQGRLSGHHPLERSTRPPRCMSSMCRRASCGGPGLQVGRSGAGLSLHTPDIHATIQWSLRPVEPWADGTAARTVRFRAGPEIADQAATVVVAKVLALTLTLTSSDWSLVALRRDQPGGSRRRFSTATVSERSGVMAHIASGSTS
jgi:hypothetical protein